ncbi:UNVERIFIED_CONTAM: hypothetical protein Sradi_6530700 [Sesamum radiatum]|uniref:MULE transposase domain-containing protein n=1 Tax=Sesamum radiatum TaxID=300843 RepID=A0AAW2JVY6_SESRA
MVMIRAERHLKMPHPHIFAPPQPEEVVVESGVGGSMVHKNKRSKRKDKSKVTVEDSFQFFVVENIVENDVGDVGNVGEDDGSNDEFLENDDALFEKFVDEASVDMGSESESNSDLIDVVGSEQDLDEHRLSDDEGDRLSFPVFYPIQMYDPSLELGMIVSLRKEFLQNFKYDPKRNVKGMRVDIMNELRCHVSRDQAYRAKRQALKKLEGSPEHQFSKLWDYAEELRSTNPGSTVILRINDENGENRFEKFYVCYNAMKQGFLGGCGPIIGMEGCHLKGPHGGVLLTAVGVDPNNNLYSIAYAVVQRENRDTWEWFLTVLKQDLNVRREEEYTFMSDK